MSAAEPADPTRDFVNLERDAAVIPLIKRRHRGSALRSVRGRRDTMTPPPESTPTAASSGPSRPLAEFAHTIEMVFLEAGRSLAEPDTKAVFLSTLDIVRRALEGSEATGIIDRGQLEELVAVIDGMRQAPGLV
jgi:hypothetical protein